MYNLYRQIVTSIKNGVFSELCRKVHRIDDPVSFPDERLFDSKWVKITTGRGVSTLTIPYLYKDDEGLYTLRMVTKGGSAEHSAFVSVAGNGESYWVFILLLLICCYQDATNCTELC